MIPEKITSCLYSLKVNVSLIPMSIGVIEGFFGPEWAQSSRESYARFMALHGGQFYIYAPKRDAHLRKEWRKPWDQEYLSFLKNLKDLFAAQELQFGVGFSPFEIGSELSPSDEEILVQKMNQLNDLGIDILGLFFDDMLVTESLAASQITIVNIVQKIFQKKIIFCPSFYTPDPILDKVFGQRPPGYLEDLSLSVDPLVDFAWTGPKVISPEISNEHLKETSLLLKRKPFLWENIFANDGPRNCKKLKLMPFSGRKKGMLNEISGIGFNMMNQPELSKIVFLASILTLEDSARPEEAFNEALTKLCSAGLKKFILENRELYLTQGLDEISQELKKKHLQELQGFSDPAAREIADWLQDRYLVGPECLTD